ncbi:MAG: hydrolase [Acidobacteriaceae bacterium]
MENENKECCPEFNPANWDNKTTTWQDKLFMQDNVFQIMHIPLNMGAVIKRMCKKIEDAGAMPDPKEFLMLCYDPSPWKSEINMTVTKDVAGGKMEKLSGTFVSKVFDGPYNHVPKWIKETDQYLANQGKKSLKYFFHYAYCPKCAKKFGHNYCVAFAQIA